MSAAVFYILAALIVLAALGAVLAPTARLVLVAVVAGEVLIGLLLVLSGAYLLGLVAMLVPAGCLLAVVALLRRAGYRELLAALPGRAAGWPAAAAVCAGIGILLFWAATTRITDSARPSPPGQGLLSVLHHRTPITVGVAVVLAAVAAGGALLIGRVGDDERLLDRALEQRHLREQRTLMRRQQRAAARAQRSGDTSQ